MQAIPHALMTPGDRSISLDLAAVLIEDTVGYRLPGDACLSRNRSGLQCFPTFAVDHALMPASSTMDVLIALRML